jgi:hypothetical protein
LYVFVVLLLAAFMAMFVIWRSPGITYWVQAEVVLAGIDAAELVDDLTRIESETCKQFLDEDFILSALQAAELIRGETTPQMESIAAQIGQRLKVRPSVANDAKPSVQIALETQHPQSAVKLLDCMTMQTEAVVTKGMRAIPAKVASQRGGSIKHGQLTVLLMLSSIVGFAGFWLAEQAKPTPILYSGQEVQEAVGLQVVVNLEDENALPVRNLAAYRRRFLRLLLTTAECGIAAVFLLIVFQLATQDAFPTRFCANPLAAYGEALTRVF